MSAPSDSSSSMKFDSSRSPLRVCNVDEEGRFGGPERRIVQVAQALKVLGVETQVLYPKLEAEEFTRQLQSYGVSATQLDITRLSKHWQTLLRYGLRFPFEVLGMARYFRKHRFDLIHVNGSYQFKVALAGRMSGTPVLWHLNDTYTAGSLKSVFNKLATRCATGFIVAGQRVYDYYLSDLQVQDKPIKEVHAPVILENFSPERFPARTENHVRKEIRIGTVSGVNPAKGLEHFVGMVAEIAKRYPEQKFIVAGARLNSQKAYSAMIDAQMDELGVRDKIEFVGFVTDVPEFLSQLDICVFTSVTEASPTSVWEALAMAKPVVTTDVGSVAQHIVPGESGFIVPVADIKGLADNVTALMEDASLREKFGRAARKVAVEQLSVEAAAAKHREIYLDIVAAARSD